MSIRLRLTLLYSGILVLTLFAFGGFLFVRQDRMTLSIEKDALLRMAERLAETREGRPVPELPGRPPVPSGSYWQSRSPDGQEILGAEASDGVVLPLSIEALQAVQGGEVWAETVRVEGERLLVYSVPVMVDGDLEEIMQVGRSLAVRDESIRALGSSLLAGGAVAAVLAFGLGWVVAGAALRPIHQMTLTAQTIGAERNFSRRVAHSGPHDEVGGLATTFNAMLAQLQAAFEQVEQTLEMQRQFVADVSHELRTPLTTLDGNVDLLRREPPISADDRAEVLEDMALESQRLIRLVNDLLTLARADAQRSFQCKPIDLQPIVEEVCRQAGVLAPDRPISCDLQPDAVVLGEADALKQVLLILLDNAINHTDGRISITISVTDGQVALSVRDGGPGIGPELISGIFERFSRGEASHSGSGSGLGLAIAKALVEAQGGSISVESQVGEGSVFTVTLPRESAGSPS